MTVIHLRNRMDRNVETKFFIDEKARVVVCIITAVNDVPRRLEKYGLADEDYDYIDEDVREYKGIARCAPEDEWNEDYGCRLAEYRAACARQKDVNRELRNFITGIDICLGNLENHGMMRNPHYPQE